jgi:hypothetical protein
MILFSYILALSVVEIGVVLNFFDAGNDFVQFGDGRHAGEARALVQIAHKIENCWVKLEGAR